MNPGLFDRTTRGLSLPDVTLTVDARAVSFFAETLGMPPAPDGSAPPTFFTFVDAAADVARRRRGEPTILERIRCDQNYLLHGEESYDLMDSIRAGDRLTVRARIADFYDSSRGHLEFAVIEQSAVEEARGLLLRARRVYIHRMIA
ncbi:MaoC family dehydratase N-terminal domain-containing protein [Sphingopyxis sp. CCNWLW253]|uniref:FAS1-like dehydratase domain-containing protein n=1 Tax=unclassified Sphingopyxis TaxID=2614943 RepID=UPI003013187B